MDSTASYDVSSSAAEFLEKEKLCQELCQNISEGVVIEPNSISISTPRDLTRTPDEEISDLLKQMNQFLSPRERDVIRSSEEKSVENLLKEAEELIRSSTPLFLNMTFDSSEKSLKSPAKNNNNNNTNANNSNNNNNNNNTPNITTPKKTKSATPLVEEEETIVENQTEDVDDAANKNTEDDRNNNKSESLKNDRITKQNNNKNLKKDVERENNNKNLKKDVEVNNSNNKNDTDGIAKTNISQNNESSQLSTTTITSNSQQSNPLLEYNNQLFKEIGDKRKKRQIPVATSPFKKSTKEIQNTEKLTLSDLAIPIASGHSVARMESNKRGSLAKSKGITPGTCCEEQKKKNIELEKIRKNYEERIFDLEQQINILNAKLKDYEYEALKVNANINESTKNQHQIELLETELRTQEQLIAGYQRENHKLCQEISACKGMSGLNK